jgi:hypothetical protein
MTDDLLPRILVMTGLLSCWAAVMWAICRYRDRDVASDIPRGTPLVFIPIVLLYKQQMRLWRSQRVRAFLKLADDLRMRQQRVDGVFPRRPRR